MSIIVRKPRNRFFPDGGNINSQRHWNDPHNPLNRRRLRLNPLNDGYDSDENPLLPWDRRHLPNHKIPI